MMTFLYLKEREDGHKCGKIYLKCVFCQTSLKKIEAGVFGIGRLCHWKRQYFFGRPYIVAPLPNSKNNFHAESRLMSLLNISLKLVIVFREQKY